MKKQKIEPTDHAVLRYLERIIGIDVENYRNNLIQDLNTAPRVQKVMDFVGNSKFKLTRNGVIYRLRDGKIITCYPD